MFWTLIVSTNGSRQLQHRRCFQMATDTTYQRNIFNFFNHSGTVGIINSSRRSTVVGRLVSQIIVRSCILSLHRIESSTFIALLFLKLASDTIRSAKWLRWWCWCWVRNALNRKCDLNKLYKLWPTIQRAASARSSSLHRLQEGIYFFRGQQSKQSQRLNSSKANSS